MRSTILIALAMAAPCHAGLAAQGTLHRSPNLPAAWGVPHGALQFNFLHRFSATDAPARKVSAAPTFILAAGAPADVTVGAKYATNSQAEARLPNEWAAFARYRWQDGERPDGDVAGRAAGIEVEYSFAGESVDAELTLEQRLGPVVLALAGRAFSAAPPGVPSLAVAGGLRVPLRSWLAVAGDVGQADDDLVWGAALQVAIPTTPHTISLQATNTNTATIRGSATPTGLVRYGFEFTIPITLARYMGGSAAPAPAARPAESEGAAPGGATAAADTVRATIQAFQYGPDTIRIAVGGVVEWTNRDPVPHTVTSDDGTFDSGMIAQGESWRRRFDRAGTFPYHCTPHPFMTGVVIVEERP